MGYYQTECDCDLCDCDLCDCDHDRSQHAGAGCRECGNTWSPHGECRAGGFTNFETRLMMLNEFWNQYPYDGTDHVYLAENLEGSCASTMPVEMAAMERAIESYEQTEQEPTLTYAS